MLKFFTLPQKIRLQTAARLLDEAFVIPGLRYRVGIDPILSIVPVAGSLFGVLFSSYFFWEAWQLKVPKFVYVRMVANIGIDFALGSVPVVGVVADAMWKSNKKNAALLLNYIDPNTSKIEGFRG
jgi:hypothetical protein